MGIGSNRDLIAILTNEKGSGV